MNKTETSNSITKWILFISYMMKRLIGPSGGAHFGERDKYSYRGWK